MSVDRGLLVILEAQPGKEDELAAFLTQAQPLAAAEPGTVTWYAFKLSDTTFGIFDTFSDEGGRQAHLNGPVAAALGQAGPGLLAKDPDIQRPTSSPRREPRDPSVIAGRADYRRTSPPGRRPGRVPRRSCAAEAAPAPGRGRGQIRWASTCVARA